MCTLLTFMCAGLPAAVWLTHVVVPQGKRGDGRPSTAAASPNSAKTALEALLTCEGLEKVRHAVAEGVGAYGQRLNGQGG